MEGIKMTKYEIYTDTFEFRYGRSRDSIPAMAADEIVDTYLSCDDRITSNFLDPTMEASFDTEEEALAEWRRNYIDYGWTEAEKGSALWVLRGRLAYLAENEYDEDGDFIQGETMQYISAEPYQA